MGRTICSGVGLLKWSILPYNLRQWYAHDVNEL